MNRVPAPILIVPAVLTGRLWAAGDVANAILATGVTVMLLGLVIVDIIITSRGDR